MKVRFKGNTSPCMVYRVINPVPVMEFDEVVFKKYISCIEIECLGLIPTEILEEVEETTADIPAIEVAVYIANNFFGFFFCFC